MKYELVYDENKMQIGVSLGTVYAVEKKYQIKLYNYGYVLFKKDFYYNKDIHLPKKIVQYFEKSHFCDKLKEELEELGIYNITESNKLMEEYREYQIKQEIARHKILNLKKTKITKGKKNDE